MKRSIICFCLFNLLEYAPVQAQEFKLNAASGYFENGGVNVMAFDDIYPEGHQSGVTIIMHGNRIASCGDIRFGSGSVAWSTIPTQGDRKLDEMANMITTSLKFSKTFENRSDRNQSFQLDYKVNVRGEGKTVIVTVDLENPIPDWFTDKVFFNLELFPGALIGKTWMMDNKQGVFPPQPNGPDLSPSSGGNVIEPYAVGRRLTLQPDDKYNRLSIETKGSDLKLYDSRILSHVGWFLVSSEAQAGATQNAIEWVITPNVVRDWMYPPVIQISQVGYHPNQPKVAVIELDKRETKREKPVLCKLTETGFEQVFSVAGREWGQFLRYNYLKFEFSNIKEEGLYKIRYGASESSVFRIAGDVYDRGVWQPVLEYFLPIQMCHMQVNENNRIWHGLCHDDDATMAPTDYIHFDSYSQGPSTLTKYKPGEVIPGLNIGGWHDAGDDDLNITSQALEIYTLATAYEAFKVDYDVTSINQKTKTVEIHRTDGKNDILQQIEHGVLSVVGAYRSMGRLYRGIITNNAHQYGLLGDVGLQTDNIRGNEDDRWVFTENSPSHELSAAAYLAAAARVLKGFNDTLSVQSLEAARELFRITPVEIPQTTNQRFGRSARVPKIHAAVELFLTTGEKEYKDFLLSETQFIINSIGQVAWFVARADQAINDANFSKAIRDVLPTVKKQIEQLRAETPYGVPYHPQIWGAGWDIHRRGWEYYFLHKAYPDIFGPEMIFDALNFILGCHPGSNTQSFASGVGANSATVAYGWNRADWSYTPGGVISGTALIRPDLPELLIYPYLWQQTEIVMGGGASRYMFLVLAAQQILNQ